MYAGHRMAMAIWALAGADWRGTSVGKERGVEMLCCAAADATVRLCCFDRPWMLHGLFACEHATVDKSRLSRVQLPVSLSLSLVHMAAETDLTRALPSC